jgi:RNA polymerase sigma factor (sigma-70 family)
MERDSFDSILRGARANAEWAWRALYDTYAPRALHYLQSQGAPDAEAVLGEAFVRVVRGIDGFEGDADAFRGWLFRIVQRCLIDARRAHRPARAIEERDLQPVSDIADDVETRASETRAFAMLRALPPDQRSVVFLRVALDLSIAEIAKILGRRPSAVKMLQQRGLRTLRERGFGTHDV